MLVAGDVGGTKTLIGFFDRAPERPRALEVFEFATADFASFDAILVRAIDRASIRGPIAAAAFGVAGPVIEQVARLTNVAWSVDAAEIAERLGRTSVSLLNDLDAMAHAIPVLEADELAVLQEGQAVPTGNAALIAPGTGLGEALLHNLDGRLVPSPSEGGHADFAARTPREIELLVDLIRWFGRAEYEHVVSGPGLVNLFRFTHPDGCAVVQAHAAGVAILPAQVAKSALERRCPRCIEAMDLFVSVFGAEAGNLALRSMATAGVYLGGGVPRKILSALETGQFLEAFRGKPPMTDLLASIPVSVVLNPQAGLLGAAVFANRAAGS
jgi:glucokinase